jgi:flavin reductase (DIM6/NTAB) family NADH-FMN oxidoreductase RutF
VPITGDLYKQIGRTAAGSVAIVATFNKTTGAVVALTVSSFVTLSFDPPMVMFAIQQNADSYSSIVSSRGFGVSLLGHRQSEIARVLARKGPNKIANVQFTRGRSLSVPLIPDALGHVECATSQILLSGDHAIVVGLVEGADLQIGNPLLYFAGTYGSFRPLDSTATGGDPRDGPRENQGGGMEDTMG